MITLEQIHILEDQVNKALEVIKKLQKENDTLRSTLESSQNKIEELETRVNAFKEDQDEIEQGIINVLSTLNELEDILPEADSHPNSRAESSDRKKKVKSEEQTMEVEQEGSEDIIENQIDIQEDKENTSEKPEEELDIF
jgi:chromosome segregation ATPase